MSTDIKKALQSLQFFREISAPQLDVITSFSSIRSVRAGETIFCQGEPSPFCFGIVSGEVMIQLTSRDRRFPPKMLGVLGPGSLFGESALFEDCPRLAMASTTQSGELITMKAPKLREWMKAEPSFALPLAMGALRASIERLHHTSQELSILDGVGRLLGGTKPSKELFASALDFLRNSLPTLEGIVLYRRVANSEKFDPLCHVPATEGTPSIPLSHALAQAATSAVGAIPLESQAQKKAFDELHLPWAPPASLALVSLGDPGFLLLASRNSTLNSPDTRLLLSAIAEPFAQALLRHP